MISVALLILACVLEGFSAANFPAKVNLTALGLAVYFLSLLVAGLHY